MRARALSSSTSATTSDTSWSTSTRTSTRCRSAWSAASRSSARTCASSATTTRRSTSGVEARSPTSSPSRTATPASGRSPSPRTSAPAKASSRSGVQSPNESRMPIVFRRRWCELVTSSGDAATCSPATSPTNAKRPPGSVTASRRCAGWRSGIQPKLIRGACRGRTSPSSTDRLPTMLARSSRRCGAGTSRMSSRA